LDWGNASPLLGLLFGGGRGGRRGEGGGWFKCEGCPLHLVFQLCSNKTRSRSQLLGVTRGRMAQTNVDQAIVRRVRPEVITEYHSSLLCNIYFGGWHLRSCSRPACGIDASGLKIEIVALGQFGTFMGRAYMHPPSAVFRCPRMFRDISLTVSGNCPVAISHPTFHD
jgi:hypothetical protein